MIFIRTKLVMKGKEKERWNEIQILLFSGEIGLKFIYL